MKDSKGVVSTVGVNRRTYESEAPAMLAEFRIRQEQHHIENGEYLSTGEESDFFPGLEADPNTILPVAWRSLRIETEELSTLRCGYSSPAGKLEQAASIGQIGKAFGFKPPAAGNWFYVIARCPGLEKFYFGSVHGHGVKSKPFSEIE